MAIRYPFTSPILILKNFPHHFNNYNFKSLFSDFIFVSSEICGEGYILFVKCEKSNVSQRRRIERERVRKPNRNCCKISNLFEFFKLNFINSRCGRKLLYQKYLLHFIYPFVELLFFIRLFGGRTINH